MPFQCTLRHDIRFTGIGLHSGRKVALSLRPAPIDSGIVFMRTDVAPQTRIRAIVENVTNTRHSTTIGSAGYAVASIEHLLAAFFATGIDNAIVEIDGPEVPAMDGSSLPFTDAILSAIAGQAASKRQIRIVRPVCISDNGSVISIAPASHLCVTCEIRFRNSPMPGFRRTFHPLVEDFLESYVPARTFGFLSEVEMLKASGLASGGSLANAVVIGQQGVMNAEGLRYEDEPVRHKILDITGDLLLAGLPVVGHVRAFRSGHFLNCRLVEKILSRPETWIMEEPAVSSPAFAKGAAYGTLTGGVTS